ncbi:MAG: hypothetical protein EOP11_08995 [Proteobacteria bacterium]|nr:MAG: hypothetical protein EOP11_08995 [Pseudomonadota bacterium]
MKIILMAIVALLLAAEAPAATGYICGNTDRSQKFTYKHTNLKYLKSYTLGQCRALSPDPDLCTAPFCQGYELSEPVRAPRRQPAPRRRPAPRVRAPKDDCDGACWAARAVESAKRQNREDEIDRLLRERREQR